MGTRQVKKIVIDTNVLVSAFLFGGVPGELIPLWKDGRIQPLASPDIIDEFIRVLSYPKFQLIEKDIDFLLNQEILPWFAVVSVKTDRSFVADDPDDDKFIWCALAGGAEYIISGDEHLLHLNPSPVPVMSPAEFLARISHQVRSETP